MPRLAKDTRDSCVSVAVRLKPEGRQLRRCASCSAVNPTRAVEVGEKTFEYDYVYGEESSQAEIYEKSVKKLVDGCFKGFNGTVFAYGQTGSGKTFSTMGLPHDSEDEGIIPRALRQIFKYLRGPQDSGRVFHDDGGALFQLASVHVSFIEIYNDECRDLLHPDIPSRDIMIREDKDGRIFFTGARDENIGSIEAAINLLEVGNVHRTTAGTFMNATSSRSHAIFTVSLELFEYPNKGKVGERGGEESSISESKGGDHGTEGHYIQSKLHLVDLAGSERAKRTGAEGRRLKESVGINQGLLALGKVIRALTVGVHGGGSGRAGHVPYRESKLTRFLQDSLGGNSQTLMLACVSPHDANTHETLSTLQYAARARAVQNKAVANVKMAPLGGTSIAATIAGGDVQAAFVASEMREEVESSLVSALRTQLGRLQEEMTALRNSREPRSTSRRYRHRLKQDKGKSESESESEGEGEEDDVAVLRASVDSLYDSISAPQLVPGGPPLGAADRDMHMVKEEGERLEDVNGRSNLVIHGESGSRGEGSSRGAISPTLLRAAGELQTALLRLREKDHPCVEDPAYQDGALWPLVASAEALVQSVRGDETGTEAETGVRGRAGVGTEETIAQLRRELAEAQEDLLQDEQVFRDKARETKRLRKALRALQEANQDLATENEHLQQQQQLPLSSGLDSADESRPGTADSFGSASVVFTADPSVTRTLDTTDKDRDSDRDREGNGSETPVSSPEQEISLTVLDSEPHISALMEDLEAVQAEKEALVRENKDVERRYTEALGQLARFQRHEQEQDSSSSSSSSPKRERDSDPSQRLRELEAGIRLKQQCIRELASRERVAQRVKEEYAERARLLEGTAEDLRRQLNSAPDSQEIQEERGRRHVLESQLNEVRQAKKALERALSRQRRGEAKVREEAAKGEQYLRELSDLRSEYARLSTHVQHEEGRHRKDLDVLTAQVATLRRASGESAALIQSLEVRNRELTARLQRSVRQLQNRDKDKDKDKDKDRGMADETATPASAPAPAPMGSRERKVAFESTLPSSPSSLGSTPPATLEECLRRTDLHLSWLATRVQELTAARLATSELARLKTKIGELESERNTTLQEYEGYVEQQRGTERKLRDTMAGVDVKLYQIEQQICNALAGSRRHTELTGARSALREHRQEIETRLQGGILKRDKVHAMHDLAEEAETLQAEIDLNRVRLAEEERKAKKGAGAGTGADPADVSRTGRGQGNEAIVLTTELLHRRAVISLSPGMACLAPEDEAMVSRALALTGQLAVEAQYKLERSRGEVQELRCHLDEKEAEALEWKQTAQTLRMEQARRMQEVRGEGERRVAAMVRQLRQLEARNLETASLLRRSTERPLSATTTPGDGAFTRSGAAEREEYLGRDQEGTASSSIVEDGMSLEDYHSYESLEQSTLRPRSTSSPSSSAAASNASAMRRRSNFNLSQDLTRSSTEQRASKEMLARWNSERERREQLEKRNQQLIRELRSVRSSIENAKLHK